MDTKRFLMIVEDDAAFAKVLRRSFERRGYFVSVYSNLDQVAEALRAGPPGFAVVDLKLDGASGLECVKLLHHADPTTRIVVLTGFASITTAVEAIKLGACHYLPKPSNTDDIEKAFDKREGDSTAVLSERPTSIKNLEWERIHETLVETEFNISETARRLGLHRRTLARKLEKRKLT